MQQRACLHNDVLAQAAQWPRDALATRLRRSVLAPGHQLPVRRHGRRASACAIMGCHLKRLRSKHPTSSCIPSDAWQACACAYLLGVYTKQTELVQCARHCHILIRFSTGESASCMRTCLLPQLMFESSLVLYSQNSRTSCCNMCDGPVPQRVHRLRRWAAGSMAMAQLPARPFTPARRQTRLNQLISIRPAHIQTLADVAQFVTRYKSDNDSAHAMPAKGMLQLHMHNIVHAAVLAEQSAHHEYTSPLQVRSSACRGPDATCDMAPGNLSAPLCTVA